MQLNIGNRVRAIMTLLLLGTLAAISIQATSAPSLENQLRALAGNSADRPELLGLLADCGALSDARQRLTQAVWTARTALRDLPESPRRDALDSVAMSLLPSVDTEE